MRAQLNKNIGNKIFCTVITPSSAPPPTPTTNSGFLDKTPDLGQSIQANWQHRINQRMFAHFQVAFSRIRTLWTRSSQIAKTSRGEAIVTGNNQQSLNWGPPTLGFQWNQPAQRPGLPGSHNQTTQFTYDTSWSRGRHEFSWGADYSRLAFNNIGQANPRGSFQFTGLATSPPSSVVPVFGADFADFLLGIPDTAAISNGNADEHFRQSQFHVFGGDNWRVGPTLTVTSAVHWNYISRP